jgi:DNA-binding CsgD family transcriptional regulator
VLDRLVAITDAINAASDPSALHKAVERGCSSFQFDGFVLFRHETDKLYMLVNATLSNATPSFVHDYDHYGWWRGDFILNEVLAHQRPVIWNLTDQKERSEEQRRFMGFLKDSHLVQGLVVPMSHRPGTKSGFAVNCRTNDTLKAGSLQAANIIGNAAVIKAEALGMCADISADAALAMRSLSNVQYGILSWIAEGKSNVDIATIIGLQERAVRYHVTEILRKLGVASRTQAASLRKAAGFSARDRTP